MTARFDSEWEYRSEYYNGAWVSLGCLVIITIADNAVGVEQFDVISISN